MMQIRHAVLVSGEILPQYPLQELQVGAPGGGSELLVVVGASKRPICAHTVDSNNHERGVGAICTHQWTCRDVCGACNARRKCQHGPLCHLVVQLTWSEACPGGQSHLN